MKMIITKNEDGKTFSVKFPEEKTTEGNASINKIVSQIWHNFDMSISSKVEFKKRWLNVFATPKPGWIVLGDEIDAIKSESLGKGENMCTIRDYLLALLKKEKLRKEN